jgi:hypothetical protein
MHFSSLAKNQFMDITAFENDLNRIKLITEGHDFPKVLNLLGGEPLLNPDIIKYCEIARGIFPDKKILIVTNGTLLPRQKAEFWEKCACLNIILQVTPYPVLTEADYTLIQKKANQYGTPLVIGRRSTSTFYWRKIPIDLTGKQSLKINKIFCLVLCKQLWHGKLYPCPIAAYVDDFNEAFNQNLEITAHDYLDIYKADAAELEAFLKGPWPFCRYCKISKAHAVTWRNNAKSRLEDWI